MNMILTLPDGSTILVMQQIDGMYLALSRQKDTGQVVCVTPNLTYQGIMSVVDRVKSRGGTVKMEYVA